MDKEPEQFCEDLLQSVREMKGNQRAEENRGSSFTGAGGEKQGGLIASAVCHTTGCFRTNLARLGARSSRAFRRS